MKKHTKSRNSSFCNDGAIFCLTSAWNTSGSDVANRRIALATVVLAGGMFICRGSA